MVAVAVAVAPNVALAPVAGAVNVTVAPATAFPNESCTNARSTPPYAVFTGALCPLPAAAVIVCPDVAAVMANGALSPDTVPVLACSR